MAPSRFTAFLAFCLVAAVGGKASADPMYTVTDLGTGNVTLATGADGQGGVTNGQVSYPFDVSHNALSSPVFTNVPPVFPAPVGDPMTYGNPENAYSYSSLSAMNDSGLGAGITVYGVNGHWGVTHAIASMRQPDGSWGPPVIIWSGMDSLYGRPWASDDTVSILGVNHQDQVLGTGEVDPFAPVPSTTAFLFDLKTGKTTDIGSLLTSYHVAPILPPGVPNGGDSGSWYLTDPRSAKLDDEGRLLVSATDGPYNTSVHTLLLTPQGVLSDPVATPEPSTLLTFTAVLGGLFVRGRLGRKRAA